MPPPINRIVIYTKKMQAMIEFNKRFFGFEAHQLKDTTLSSFDRNRLG